MRRTLALLFALAVLLTACSGTKTKVDVRGTAGKNISHAADVPVPDTVLGLDVKAEDVTATIAATQRAYIDSLVMYGLRRDNLLQATFQVSRFNSGSNYKSTKFRQELVNQIGNEAPVTIDVGGQIVYITVGNRQNLNIWFKGSYLFVLATRQDYDTPKALLRALLSVNP